MGDLMKFLNARRTAYHTSPKLIDEVIYTPYMYLPSSSSGPSSKPNNSGRTSTSPSKVIGPKTGDLLGIPELRSADSGSGDATARDQKRKKRTKFDLPTDTEEPAEIFLFEYGTVVLWNMTGEYFVQFGSLFPDDSCRGTRKEVPHFNVGL
jgi:uncharacterized Rmd1/YagE family protein